VFQEKVLSPFLNSIQKFSERNAFYIGGEYFTYKQLGERVCSIRSLLKDNSDEVIALIANNDLETYASIFALWLEGKAYIPINPDVPHERNCSIIEQVNITTVLDSTDKVIHFGGSNTIATKYNNVRFLGEMYNPVSVDDKRIAYILFTSGSTGVPKGVPISRENLAYFVESFWDLGYELNHEDRCLQMFELTFDLSVVSYLIPLLVGGCVYTIPKDKIKYSYIYELMDEHELTMALMVPSMLNYLRPYFDEIDCPKMKYSMFCGEALYLSIVNEWAKCVPNAQIDNVYGPTENTIYCTRYSFNRTSNNEVKNDVLSIGKAMYNSYIEVFDEKNEIADIGEAGELCLSGKQLTAGYYNNDKMNKEKFFFKNIEGREIRFYRTGDLCVRNSTGNFDFIGRADSQVKIQGYRIELGEIEFHCREFLKDINVVAVTFTNSSNNTEIALAIESNERISLVEELKEYLYSKIPVYMIPTRYHFVSRFAVNSSDKIDRVQIKKRIENE